MKFLTLTLFNVTVAQLSKSDPIFELKYLKN